MFDSREIARRAMLRAEEIKAERRKRARGLISMCSMASVMVIVVVYIALPSSDIAADDIDDTGFNAAEFSVVLEDDLIPLAMFPMIQDEPPDGEELQDKDFRKTYKRIE